MPVAVSFGFVAVGLIIGLIGGFTHGSWAGGIIAALGIFPAMVGLWKGIQQETQTTLGLSVLAVLVSLGVGGLLIVLKLAHYLHWT
ncbi:MAG TPA: hypothetical protein VHE35_11925 [Kofleriaceae bacterium]|nr:hypothetical protein [Kofleriaceae bacterium]